MPSECIFEFDHPNKVYFSGETISGRVKLHTKKPKHVKSVYLLFEGVAKVCWGTPTRPSETRYEDTLEIFRGNEIFIKDHRTIFSEGRLPPGQHTYNFSIPLPANCQTSMTEKFGEISYVISLHIDRELRYNNVFWHPLTVIKPLNLNCYPEYLTPLQGECIKYICCFPCSSGPIKTTMSIPYSGWAPGQDINYTLIIDNKSRYYDIEGTKLNFIQTYKFTSMLPKKKTCTLENNLDKLQAQDRVVLRRTKREFKGRLRIPSIPPSTPTDYSIIQISYRIGIEIHNGECHLDSIIWIPITIGTIPLTQSLADDSSDVMKAFTPPTSPDMPPSYDMCMPANYQEPTLIGAKFKDIDRDPFYLFADWLPKYPVYNKFTDDLSIQVAGLQNLSAPPTNLFQSEITASAPVDAATDEKRNAIEAQPLILYTVGGDPNVASTSRQSPYLLKNELSDKFLNQ